jgi:hypothetical protein
MHANWPLIFASFAHRSVLHHLLVRLARRRHDGSRAALEHEVEGVAGVALADDGLSVLEIEGQQAVGHSGSVVRVQARQERDACEEGLVSPPLPLRDVHQNARERGAAELRGRDADT